MKYLRTACIVMWVCGLLTAGTMTSACAETASPIIIDVRTEQEWKTGHLEESVLIPHEQISKGITEISSDKKAQVFLYCRSGRRSGIAQDILRKNGYENVTNLGSVESASRELGRPIVK